ncbi:unnamed protein product [Rhodiola kirilowii]
MTAFEALYGREPPTLLDYEPRTSPIAAVNDLLSNRTTMLHQLRSNLLRAQQRMSQQTNLHRSDTEFAIDDWVLLHLQPYRQHSMRPRYSPKLAKRYYGPFRITERIGKVAYRLALPLTARIHDIFHVSLLKRCCGQPPFYNIEWPDSFSRFHPLLLPDYVVDTRTIQRQENLISQARVVWKGQDLASSTWEDVTDLVSDYPDFNLEVEVPIERGVMLHQEVT